MAIGIDTLRKQTETKRQRKARSGQIKVQQVIDVLIYVILTCLLCVVFLS